MNVYEAYLSIMKGNVLKIKVGEETHFALKTDDWDMPRLRIHHINLEYMGKEPFYPKSLDKIRLFCTGSVCLDCFDKSAIFEEISQEEFLKIAQTKWHEKNP